MVTGLSPQVGWQSRAQAPVDVTAAGVVFLFPVLAVTAPHGATGTFGVLFALGLVFGWQGWRQLYRWEKQVLTGFLAYAATVGLSMLIASEHLADAFDGYSKHLRFVAFVPIYLMTRRFGLDLSRPLITAIVAGLFVMCAVVVNQRYALGIERPGGSRDPVQFADVLMLCTVLAGLAMVTLRARAWQYLLGAVAIGAGLYASYLSLTRNAWLLVPIVFILVLAHERRHMTRLRSLLLAGSFVVLCVLCLHPRSLVFEGFQSGYQDIELYMEAPGKFSSWGLRLNMWRNALIIGSDEPWFGTGLGDYDEAAGELLASGTSYSQDPMLLEQAHNAFIHTFAESGVFALLAFTAGLLVTPLLAFARHWGTRREHGSSFAVLGGMTVTLAFAIFGIGHAWMGSNNFISIYLLFMLVFLSSLAVAEHRAAADRRG